MTDPNRPPTEGPAQPASTDPTPTPTQPTPTQPAPETPEPGRDPLRGSRTSGAWATVIVLGLVLLLLVVFIAQNTQQVDVSFLGWTGQAPLAVALLIAAVAGLALTAVAGSLRILQLRRRVRRDAKR